MHTAIYVQKPTTVTIRAKNRAKNLYLYQYGSTKAAEKPTGELKLKPGIYVAVSSGELEVTGEHAQAASLNGNKDEWPDPPGFALTGTEGATAPRIRKFFNEIVKGGEVG